jgi:hypothetical protein
MLCNRIRDPEKIIPNPGSLGSNRAGSRIRNTAGRTKRKKGTADWEGQGTGKERQTTEREKNKGSKWRKGMKR